jgi:hypothetical protein
MTNGEAALHLGMGGGKWTETQSSQSLTGKTKLDKCDFQPSPFGKLRAGSAGLLRCRLRIGLALFRISLPAPSCGKAGRLAGRGARAAELSSAEDEKDLLVRPLGRARDGSPGLALGFRNAMFPSCWRLSPLFYQGGQIFIFSAPISCLGNGCISQLIVFRQGPSHAPMLAATVLE